MNEKTAVYPDVEPTGDKIYRLAEAAASLLPAGQVLLSSLISPPIQNRMQTWVASVEKRITKLESKGLIDYQSLTASPEFSALLLRSLNATAINSQKEKLSFLENFLVNIALNPKIEEDEVYVLHGILSDSTPSHIKALSFYQNPKKHIVKLKEIYERRNFGYPDKNRKQGWELFHVLGVGDIEYWQNIFSTNCQHNILKPAEMKVDPGCANGFVIHGSMTTLGGKLLSLIENREENEG